MTGLGVPRSCWGGGASRARRSREHAACVAPRDRGWHRVRFRQGRRPAAKDAALSRCAQVAAHRTVARPERQARQLLLPLLLPRGAGGAARNRVEPCRVLAFGGGGPVGALVEDKDVARPGRKRLARPRRRRPAAEDARVVRPRSRARARRGCRRIFGAENAARKGALGDGVARGTCFLRGWA
eukprot:CAMPEP_0185316786 /NCGR_PEP_ID=MMETSP1363-20130426/45048_1 /TAXON_ID=38817 /ORGANISM="Gephyrocapsa oceanica, Strain RCC1303" /LENGTH=182 /DNA_ID=CAMNT_0027915005 /DNA_START=92 /DNA_END=637 /DNA_ORIENTATION=-